MNRQLLREIIRREIQEAMKISHARKFMQLKRDANVVRRLENIFNKLSKMKGAITYKNNKTKKIRKERIYFPFGAKVKVSVSDAHREIVNKLTDLGYTDIEYIKNSCKSPKGQFMKLSKALARENLRDLLGDFNADKTRENSTRSEFMLCFSKHKYDVAGASTGRGWASCMDLDGRYAENYADVYLPGDVTEGTVVCYLISHNGKDWDYDLKSPVARISIKPFIGNKSGDVAYFSESKIYGTAPPNFFKSVQEIFRRVNGQKFEKYYMNCNLYNDSNNAVRMGNPLEPTEADKEAMRVHEVKRWLRSNGIHDGDYDINYNNTIDIYGDVQFESNGDGILAYQLGEVEGSMNVRDDYFKSFENFPSSIEGDLEASDNKLKSFENFPEYVGGYVDLSDNYIRSFKGLEGCKIKGEVNLRGNMLTNFVGFPKFLEGSVDVEDNRIESFKGLDGCTIQGDLEIGYLNPIINFETLMQLKSSVLVGGTIRFNVTNLGLTMEQRNELQKTLSANIPKSMVRLQF